MNLNERLNDADLKSYSKRSDKAARPIDNGFDNLSIAENLMKPISRFNFKTPTPIQQQSIPAGIRGEDIIAVAQTGSGKTLAYGIPMIQRLAASKKGAGLVLVPTRELAIQVEESLRSISRSVHIQSVVLIGGASIHLQINALNRKPRIIIATPGRLMDLIDRKNVNLDNIEVFILDEADRMLDMGFVPDIKKIMKSIPDDRQTMLFSATMPKEIEAIARQLMPSPTRIETDRSGATPVEVSHEMFVIKNFLKSQLLALQLKQYTGPVLIFTRTKRMASKLTQRVNRMGFAAAEIHSDRSQGQRRNALEGFKRGRYQILIATDIAARGIDVTGIELVVNYDMPANSEDYVHRIGRTGRAGKTGHAISYANVSQKGSIRSIERFMNTRLEISPLPELPSEELLYNQTDQSNFRREPSRDDRPPRRKYSKESSSQRGNYKKRDSNKFAPKRSDSIPENFRRKDSDKSESSREGKKSNVARRKEYSKFSKNRTATIPDYFKRKDADQSESKRKVSGRKDSERSDFSIFESDKEKSYWSNSHKGRNGKKRSVGQGSKRKKRSKRK